VGKPFVILHAESVLEQVLVKNASKLTKHHAFGVLELFRKTDLPSGDAWKVPSLQAHDTLLRLLLPAHIHTRARAHTSR